MISASYDKYIDSFIDILEKSKSEKYFSQLHLAYVILRDAVVNNRLILMCGNGGSASDSSHFAAELICRFEKDREPIKAISLVTDLSVVSAISNDISYNNIFKRQVNALGAENDVLVIFSTSGGSLNCLEAAKAAKKNGLRTILFTGSRKASIGQYADVIVEVPSTRTCHIQEVHRVQYHLLCSWIEQQVDRVE